MKNFFAIFLMLSLLFFYSCKNEKKEFLKACQTNTSEAYTEFLKKFPESNLADSAKNLRLKADSIDIKIQTYLGNWQRNYYGDSLPDNLNIVWKLYLGEGISPAYGYDKVWKGAGWTGQPLLVIEKNKPYLIHGAFDYGLRKIDATNGKLIWYYKFDDIIKGTGTIFIDKNANNIEDRYIIIQGSRKGRYKSVDTSEYCWSLRAISYISGKEIWRMNSEKTRCYSRDVDGSAIVFNDTAYLALENGLFTIFNPKNNNLTKIDSFYSPQIYKQILYYNDEDIKNHGDDLVPEASPILFLNHIFTPSGTGKIYGYNINKGQNDFEFFIGADLNGSMPLTYDSCLLVPIEKQYIKGNGGVMKINPFAAKDKIVQWFQPVDSLKWYHWEGGIIGSVAINDKTKNTDEPYLAVFNDCAGYLYIVEYDKIQNDTLVKSTDDKTLFHPPVIKAKIKTEGTISTPIIVQNRILVPTDKGIFLYEIQFDDNNLSVKLLDKIPDLSFDATPITWNGKIYLACLDGYLYCFGTD